MVVHDFILYRMACAHKVRVRSDVTHLNSKCLKKPQDWRLCTEHASDESILPCKRNKINKAGRPLLFFTETEKKRWVTPRIVARSKMLFEKVNGNAMKRGEKIGI